MSRIFRFRSFMSLMPLLALTMVAYAFAASNTVPASSAGDGSGAISGYTVSNVHYTLNATNPANIDNVSFTIAPALLAGGSVQVKLVSAGGSWFNCTVTGGTSVSCATPGVTVLA